MVDSDTYAEAPVLRARVEVPATAVDEALDALWGLEPAVGAWQDMESGRAWLQAFSVDAAALAPVAAAMECAAAGVGAPCKAEIEALPREDWAESWKRFFHVVKISKRVWIRPPWEDAEPDSPDGVVVCIEPGMSFGTGLHGTTQSCLKLIESLAPKAVADRLSMLDLGCGSGILSIAARMLGFADVRGVDYDAAAVRVATENAANNGLADVPYALCDVTVDPIPRADIVVANILAPVLVAAAPRIAGAVSRRPGAALVLSGILATQYETVRSAYAAHGFAEESAIVDGEWKTGLFRRRAWQPAP